MSWTAPRPLRVVMITGLPLTRPLPEGQGDDGPHGAPNWLAARRCPPHPACPGVARGGGQARPRCRGVRARQGVAGGRHPVGRGVRRHRAARQPRVPRLRRQPPKAPERPADPGREVHRNTFGADLPWGTGAVTVGGETFDEGRRPVQGQRHHPATPPGPSRSRSRSTSTGRGGAGRFGGSKTINLHCGVTDPSKCRETLGYAVYRARRGARPADRPGRGAAHRAGQVRQGTARPLHDGRGGGQAVPAGPLRRRQGAADEARGPPRVRRPGRRLGPVQEAVRARSGSRRRPRRSG